MCLPLHVHTIDSLLKKVLTLMVKEMSIGLNYLDTEYYLL